MWLQTIGFSSLLSEYFSSACMHHIFFIRSSAEVHVGCFHFLALRSDAAVHMGCKYHSEILVSDSLDKNPDFVRSCHTVFHRNEWM